MINFCTYFDINYIHKGLALYDSLSSTGDEFKLWILCFDNKVYGILKELDLPNVKLISESEFEYEDHSLVNVKSSRSRVEYYWTSTASLPLYIFEQDPTIDVLIYLDADIFFFSSPIAILNELGDGDILIVPHDYSIEYNEDHSEAGIYNVGVMAFRNSINALKCLQWWRKQCIEWCFWRYENGQIGDQAYLNDWPERFEKVVVCRNIGINAAPWNVAKYGLDTINDQFFIGSTPLVCYHFHYIRICLKNLAFIGGFKINLKTRVLSLIYRPYIHALEKVEDFLYLHNYPIEIPKSGVPWRYIVGRVAKMQPVKHFLWLKKNSFI